MVTPVDVVHLDKLDWVRLNVDCKVEEVAARVNESLNKDQRSRDLVKVDVVVQRKYLGKADSSQGGDGQSENENEDQDAVEKQRFAARSREHVENIGRTIESRALTEVNCSLYHDD